MKAVLGLGSVMRVIGRGEKRKKLLREGLLIRNPEGGASLRAIFKTQGDAVTVKVERETRGGGLRVKAALERCRRLLGEEVAKELEAELAFEIPSLFLSNLGAKK